jgi:hypothetical protein
MTLRHCGIFSRWRLLTKCRANAVARVAKYLVGWQRPGDFGFSAEQNGEVIGAAWAPRFSAEELKFQ